jgi:hypothetical protein
MAQTTPSISILRRRQQSAKDLYEAAAEGLKAQAPLIHAVAEDSPPLPAKWVQLVDFQVGRILSNFEQMKGLSDANRYRIRGKNYEHAVDAFEKALFDGLLEMIEAFRQKRGTREVFKLADVMQDTHEQGC